MKRIKYFLCVALAVTLLMSMAVTMAAADPSEYNAERKASISLTLTDGTTAVRGAQVSVYRVADLIINSDGYAYSYLEDYTNCGLIIDDPQSRDLAEEMYAYVCDNNIAATVERYSDVHGYVYFDELDHGLYLIAQTTTVEGFTPFSPFLTYLPITDESGWVYDVIATPKIDITPDEPDNPPPPPPPSETTTTVTTTIPVETTPSVTTTPPVTIPQWPTTPPTVTTVTTTEPEETEVTEETTEETEETEETTEETTVETEPTQPFESIPEITTEYNPHDDDANAGQWGEHDPHDDDANAGQWGELAQTGQLNWPIPILAGMGSAFIAIGFIMRITRRKRDNNEK